MSETALLTIDLDTEDYSNSELAKTGPDIGKRRSVLAPFVGVALGRGTRCVLEKAKGSDNLVIDVDYELDESEGLPGVKIEFRRVPVTGVVMKGPRAGQKNVERLRAAYASVESMNARDPEHLEQIIRGMSLRGLNADMILEQLAQPHPIRIGVDSWEYNQRVYFKSVVTGHLAKWDFDQAVKENKARRELSPEAQAYYDGVDQKVAAPAPASGGEVDTAGLGAILAGAPIRF